MSEPFFDLLTTTGFAGGIGAFCWVLSFRGLIKARTIEDTPTSKIRSAHQGYVELTGFSKESDNGLLSGPLTKSPCVWYRYKIEKYESSGKNSHWRTIEKKFSKTPFVLDDDTGQCFVHPDKADITTGHRQVWYGGSRYPTSTSSSGMFNRRYRYTEERIHQEDFLYCIGQFQSINPPTVKEQTKARMGEILNQWKQDYDALVKRFDRNSDGELDMDEWEHARRKAELTAYQEVRDNYDHNQVHILSYSPHRRQPFLISNSDPQKLVKKYRWQFILAGIAALVATGAFFYLLPSVYEAWQYGR